MMGYTHAAIGAAGALAATMLSSEDLTPGLYVVAVVAGVLGGIIVDADVVDKREPNRVTDGSRTRLAGIGILLIAMLLDAAFKVRLMSGLRTQYTSAFGGVVALIMLGIIAHLIGRFIGHRTFSHSLWFIGLTTLCVYYICPPATVYFFTGALLHLLFDLLNYQAPNKDRSWHGVWLFYPIKRGEGIALRKCKAFGRGNTTLYFIAIVLLTVITGYYVWLIRNSELIAIPIVLLAVIVIDLHFVRVKSEKEMQK